VAGGWTSDATCAAAVATVAAAAAATAATAAEILGDGTRVTGEVAVEEEEEMPERMLGRAGRALAPPIGGRVALGEGARGTPVGAGMVGAVVVMVDEVVPWGLDDAGCPVGTAGVDEALRGRKGPLLVIRTTGVAGTAVGGALLGAAPPAVAEIGGRVVAGDGCEVGGATFGRVGEAATGSRCEVLSGSGVADGGVGNREGAPDTG